MSSKNSATCRFFLANNCYITLWNDIAVCINLLTNFEFSRFSQWLSSLHFYLLIDSTRFLLLNNEVIVNILKTEYFSFVISSNCWFGLHAFSSLLESVSTTAASLLRHLVSCWWIGVYHETDWPFFQLFCNLRCNVIDFVDLFVPKFRIRHNTWNFLCAVNHIFFKLELIGDKRIAVEMFWQHTSISDIHFEV